jgi:hypothetical protein
MSTPTQPPIFVAQNTTDARRKVAAQARLYSDAKTVWSGRLTVIIALAVANSVAALFTADTARTTIGVGGGVLLLIISLVGSDVEKRKRAQAAAVQEDFDTEVFRLPWNPLEGKRPSPVVIARAAERYDGGRDENWYADTEGTHRPFDVLVCQGSNLGWGATTHRIWAWTLTSVLVTCLLALTAVTAALSLSASTISVAVVAPAIAPLTEVLLQIKAHFTTGRDKEAAEGLINAAWADGMSGKEVPSRDLLQRIQAKILSFRQQNHYVPDWLDDRLHARNESAMQATVADRVAEAARNGHG